MADPLSRQFRVDLQSSDGLWVSEMPFTGPQLGRTGQIGVAPNFELLANGDHRPAETNPLIVDVTSAFG